MEQTGFGGDAGADDVFECVSLVSRKFGHAVAVTVPGYEGCCVDYQVA